MPEEEANTTPESGVEPESQAGPDPGADAVEAIDAAQEAVESLKGTTGLRSMELPDLERALPDDAPDGLELLADVNLNVKIELGRTRMLVEDVLRLGEGAVVELDKLAGDPVDIYVNEQPVARGEVLVVNDTFCVRVSDIIDVDGVQSVAESVSANEDADAAADEQSQQEEAA